MTIDQAPAWMRRLMGERRKAAERGLVSAGHRLVQAIVTEIIPREPRIPVDRGIYRGGWRVEEIEGGAEVVNRVPHASFIEDGVRGENVKIGRAMIDALAEWVHRHGLDKGSNRDEKGRYVGASKADARQVAWAIALSMKEKGIFGGEGLKILEKARKRFLLRFITEEVTAELEKIE